MFNCTSHWQYSLYCVHTLLIKSSDVFPVGFLLTVDPVAQSRMDPPGREMGAQTQLMMTLRAERWTSAESWGRTELWGWETFCKDS